MLTRSRPGASKRLVRFLVCYEIKGKQYSIVLPGESASHVRTKWDRQGSTFLSAQECDIYGRPK